MQVRFLSGAFFVPKNNEPGENTLLNTRSGNHNNRRKKSFSEQLYDLKTFLMQNYKIVMPGILVIAIALTVIIGLLAHRTNKGPTVESQQAATLEDTEGLVGMEKNAHADVNELFRTYYDALAEGDIETIESISSPLSDEEKIRIQTISESIESYPTIDVYTKQGPSAGTYVCYVYTILKFVDHDWLVPGMQTMYVCTRDDGSGKLFINTQEEHDADVTNYIQKVSVQDDVVDLNNQITANYNQLLASDPNLVAYLDELSQKIDVKVGQSLSELKAAKDSEGKSEESEDASTQESEAAASGEENSAEAAPAASSDNNQEQTEASAAASSSSGAAVSNPTKAKAKETVAIRKGSGTTTEQIGSAYPGDTFDVVKYDPNGWSQIKYNGQTAYVKSEFFTFE